MLTMYPLQSQHQPRLPASVSALEAQDYWWTHPMGHGRLQGSQEIRHTLELREALHQASGLSDTVCEGRVDDGKRRGEGVPVSERVHA